MTTPEDDLIDTLTAPPDPAEAELGFHQGIVISFDLDTGENIIRIKDTDFIDLPVMNVTDSTALEPDMIVGVLRIRSMYFVLGRIASPGSSQFGDITVRAEDGSEVSLRKGALGFLRGKQLDSEVQGVVTAHGADQRVWLEAYPPYTRNFAGQSPRDNILILEGRSSESSTGGAWLLTPGQLTLEGGASAFFRGGPSAHFESNLSSGYTSLKSGANMDVRSETGQITVQAQGILELRSQANDVRVPTVNGASSSPVVRMDGVNRLYKDSSVRASKLEIEDLDIMPENVLKLRPRTWLDRGQVEREEVKLGERTPRAAGFVAEELDEIPGMEPFLYRDSEGALTAIAYEKIPAALLVVIQDQQRQIEELTARVSALEARD